MNINCNSATRDLTNFRSHSLLVSMLLGVFLLLTPLANASTLFGEVLQASDSSPRNAYGYSVAISGDTAAIGAWFGDGAVYIMQLDPDTGAWQETQKIETPEIAAGRANFGFSVWLDGDQLVVGAPNIILSRPGAVSGFAFIYERDSVDGTWQLVNTTEGETAGPDEFPSQGPGRDVVVDQGLAVISRDDGDTDSILTYEKDLMTGTWVQTETLIIDQSVNTDIDTVASSITALGLANDRLAVGVNINDSNGLSRFELRLFEYNRELGTWDASAQLDGVDAPNVAANFRRLAMDNNQLLITGAVGEGPILFSYDTQTAQWSRDTNFSSDVFNVVSEPNAILNIDGSRVVLRDDRGGATVFERNGATGRWAETLQLSTTLLGVDTPTVTSIDLEGDHILLGTPYIDDFTGALLAYRLDDLDSDGVAAIDDNCPGDFNPTQENFDADLLGDVCDLDDDNDGVEDNSDGFPLDPDRQDAPVSNGSGEPPLTPRPSWPFGGGIALETDFRWPAISDASYYVIEVQHNGSIRAYEPFIAASSACFNNQCQYIKSDAARNGGNRWRLRAGNDAGVSPWSEWVDFFVGQAGGANSGDFSDPAFAEIPAVPVLQLPFGSSSVGVTDYVWSASPGVIEYAFEVRHEGAIRGYEPAIAASEACSSELCTYTKSDAALIGENRWRVRAINNAGASAWSDWFSFVVTDVAVDPTAPVDAFIPETPTLISPTSESGMPVVDYRWGDVSGATVYAVEVQHQGIIRGYQSNLLASEACDAGECIYSKPDAALTGENRWRVRAGNSNGFSVWSEWQSFNNP